MNSLENSVVSTRINMAGMRNHGLISLRDSNDFQIRTPKAVPPPVSNKSYIAINRRKMDQVTILSHHLNMDLLDLACSRQPSIYQVSSESSAIDIFYMTAMNSLLLVENRDLTE
ncbi:hypothetical protein CSKR_107317, partial [Clonorchis sinensis]